LTTGALGKRGGAFFLASHAALSASFGSLALKAPFFRWSALQSFNISAFAPLAIFRTPIERRNYKKRFRVPLQLSVFQLLLTPP